MNLRARIKNSVKWASVCGVGGAVVGGGIATAVYYFKNNPEEVYTQAIKHFSAVYGCDYSEPTPVLRARPSCYLPYTEKDGDCIYKYHNICKEVAIQQEASKLYNPLAEINSKNTIEFMGKFAAPIGFAAGAVAGLIIGFCKTPSQTPRVSTTGLFSGSRDTESKEAPLLEGIEIEQLRTQP